MKLAGILIGFMMVAADASVHDEKEDALQHEEKEDSGPMSEECRSIFERLHCRIRSFTDEYRVQCPRNARITDKHVAGLSACQTSAIVGLEIDYNEITSLEWIQGFQGLRKLSLMFNKIEDLRPLGHLKKIDELTLLGNQITILKPLEHMKYMKRLSLGHNNITRLDSLSKLVKLERLFLERNKISKIDQLEGLSGLNFLDLSGNTLIFEDANKVEGQHLLSKKLTKMCLFDDEGDNGAIFAGPEHEYDELCYYVGFSRITCSPTIFEI